MIGISFAMTSDAYADYSKTETRRFWAPKHAAKFRPGTVFMGWTKDPRAGGVRMHPARVVSCKTECLFELSEESFVREGGTRYWPNREAYIEVMGEPSDEVFVLRFEHLPFIVTVKSAGNGYRAICNGFTATCTGRHLLAAAKAAAKAMGLCEGKCPAGVWPSDYNRQVEKAAEKVRLTVLDETHSVQTFSAQTNATKRKGLPGNCYIKTEKKRL